MMVKYLDAASYRISNGDDDNWNLSDPAFDQIANGSGVKLKDCDRQKLRSIMLEYNHGANIAKGLERPERFFDLAESLIKSTQLLLDDLRQLGSGTSDEYAPLLMAIHGHDVSPTDLFELEHQTRLLQSSCIHSARSLKSKVRGGKGRGRRPYFDQFIQKLAAVFETVGGRISASYSENTRTPTGESGMRDGPFVRFVEGHIRHLPKNLHLQQPTLGEAINRALSRNKRRPNKANEPRQV